MPRRVNAGTGNGHNTIHVSGCYQSVLQKLCEQATYETGTVLLCETDEEMEQWRREYEQRRAALMAKISGEPLIAHSAHLPSGLPTPFEPFPRGGQRCFMVRPDDTITLQERVRWVR
jgi:hypothetical protein